jgi:hypothetical protein
MRRRNTRGLRGVFNDEHGGETLEWALAMGLVVVAAVAGIAHIASHMLARL